MNIGQTRRSVETRIKKHHRFTRLGHPDKSAVAEHTFNRHHLIKFLKPRPSVIYAASKSGWRLSLHPPKQYLQRGWPNFESHANLSSGSSQLWWLTYGLLRISNFVLRFHAVAAVPFNASPVEHLLDLLPFLPSGHGHIPTLLIQHLVSFFLFFHFHFYSYFRWFLPYSFNYLPITLYILFSVISHGFTCLSVLHYMAVCLPGCFSLVYHRDTAFSLPSSYSILMYFVFCLISFIW